MMIRTILILSVTLALAIGCSSANEDSHDSHDHGGKSQAMDHGSMDHGSTEHPAGDAAHGDTAKRNLICPVMGGETADSEIFTEYNGRKVYFCCDGCVDDFKKNPEKYFAKAYPEAE